MTPSPDRKAEATDLELIDRWKGGDSLAATQLVGRHSPALARFAVSAWERSSDDYSDFDSANRKGLPGADGQGNRELEA